MSKESKTWGEWAITLPPPQSLRVDRILGARVQYAEDGRPRQVEIQLQDAAKHIRQMALDVPNAMFLLSLLKSIQLHEGFPFPDDPRHPDER